MCVCAGVCLCGCLLSILYFDFVDVLAQSVQSLKSNITACFLSSDEREVFFYIFFFLLKWNAAEFNWNEQHPEYFTCRRRHRRHRVMMRAATITTMQTTIGYGCARNILRINIERKREEVKIGFAASSFFFLSLLIGHFSHQFGLNCLYFAEWWGNPFRLMSKIASDSDLDAK